MKIYFCGSISGGRGDASIYHELINTLKNHGKVLTEHVGNLDFDENDKVVPQDKALTPVEVHDRDMDWLTLSDVIFAEVTQPSLGVGYEIGRAIAMKKTIVCLFREGTGKRLSFMIDGAQKEHTNISVKRYIDLKEAKDFITDYFKSDKILNEKQQTEE